MATRSWWECSGYEWVLLSQVIDKAKLYYSKGKLPWSVADKTLTLTVNFHDFLGKFISSEVDLTIVFSKISSSKKKKELQNITFTASKGKSNDKYTLITMHFGLDASAVPATLIKDFWSQCDKLVANIVDDLIEEILDDYIRYEEKIFILADEVRLNGNFLSRSYGHNLYQEIIRPKINELIDAIHDLSWNCQEDKIPQMLVFQDKVKQKVLLDLADQLRVELSEMVSSTEKMMVASAAEFLKTIHSDNGPSEKNETLVYKAVISSFLHSGQLSQKDIAAKLKTSRYSIHRVNKIRSNGMAMYQHDFIEYGDDRLEVDDFFEDALSEAESEGDLRNMDESVRQNLFAQQMDVMSENDSDEFDDSEDIRNLNADSAADSNTLQLKRSVDDSFKPNFSNPYTPGNSIVI